METFFLAHNSSRQEKCSNLGLAGAATPRRRSCATNKSIVDIGGARASYYTPPAAADADQERG